MSLSGLNVRIRLGISYETATRLAEAAAQLDAHADEADAGEAWQGGDPEAARRRSVAESFRSLARLPIADDDKPNF